MSLTHSRGAFSVFTTNSYSPVSAARTEPCQVTRYSCENCRKPFSGTRSTGSRTHRRETSFSALCSGIGLLVPKSNRISGLNALQVAASAAAPPPTRPRRILSLEAPRLVPISGIAEAADQVGHGVAVLPHGQARELDPRRPERVAGLRGLRVERVIHIGSDVPGILTHARPRIILGHRLGDDLRQTLHRALADQRLRIVIVGPFPRRTMARGARLMVDLFALSVGRGRDRQGYPHQQEPPRHHPRKARRTEMTATAEMTDCGRGIRLHGKANPSKNERVFSRGEASDHPRPELNSNQVGPGFGGEPGIGPGHQARRSRPRRRSLGDTIAGRYTLDRYCAALSLICIRSGGRWQVVDRGRQVGRTGLRGPPATGHRRLPRQSVSSTTMRSGMSPA